MTKFGQQVAEARVLVAMGKGNTYIQYTTGLNRRFIRMIRDGVEIPTNNNNSKETSYGRDFASKAE